MSEGQEYHDSNAPGQHQIAHQPPQDSPPAPVNTVKGKRKRTAAETEDKEDGRINADGGKTSRRTSFQQSSPQMNSAFMPINSNQQQTNQYAYPTLNVAQGQQQSMNGSQDNTALAADAMSSLLPQLNQNMSYADLQAKQEHVPIDNQFQMQQDVHQQHQQVQPVQQQAPPPPPPARPQPTPKPQVGTEEWHKQRRDNHKEVERRRRETINEGINELAKIVPNCEKNKGSILQRAVQYIMQLKEAETTNIEKWTLEKLLTEQAIQELSQANEKLKLECERAWREAETWKKSCLQAGVTPSNQQLQQQTPQNQSEAPSSSS